MSDFEDFVKIADSVKSEYAVDGTDPWASSPFGWVKKLPSRTVGAIGEKFVSSWATSQGFKVSRTGDSDADRIIQGRRIEIKFSTLWAGANIYKFQQIRDQDYEYCFCLGVSPNEVHSWLIPKAELMKVRPGLSHQHGGASGTDTFWLAFEPANPPSWLIKYGSSLSDVKKLISKI